MSIVSPRTAAACSSDLSKEERLSGNHESRTSGRRNRYSQIDFGPRHLRDDGKAAREGFSGLELNPFLGGAPAVFNKCLFRERRFINREVKYIFFLFDLHNEGLNVHTLLPQSGGYLTWQSGALGETKPELF